MKKHHREIIQRVRRIAPSADITLLPVTGHTQMCIQINGVSKRITVSNTPSRPEITVIHAVKDVVRLFNLK